MRLVRINAPGARKAAALLLSGAPVAAEHPLFLAGRLHAAAWLARRAGAVARARRLERECEALVRRFSCNPEGLLPRLRR
jgi:hypothetical protein